jgi:hypothetical protein
MIKTVGFGQRRVGMSHDDCVNYHIRNHAPFGRRVAGPRGLTKYIGYYPDAAYSLDGKRLPAISWDFIVPEWFTEEFFFNINAWRDNDPEGREITIDEARFCDRTAGFMMTCDEDVVIEPKGAHFGVDVVYLLNRRPGMTHEQCVNYHRTTHLPLALELWGDRLQMYRANYMHQSFNLEQGLMPEPPYDIVVLARFDSSAWMDLANWMRTAKGVQLAKGEQAFLDRSSSHLLECKVSVYIP